MSKRKVTVDVPIPMPTWNRILAMNKWERKRLRDSIHEFVSISPITEDGSLIRTVSAAKQRLTVSLNLDSYLTMIRPKSKASPTPKSKSAPKKKSTPSSNSKKSKGRCPICMQPIVSVAGTLATCKFGDTFPVSHAK